MYMKHLLSNKKYNFKKALVAMAIIISSIVVMFPTSPPSLATQDSYPGFNNREQLYQSNEYTIKPIVFSLTSSNGMLIADFYNTLDGFTETFDLTFKDAYSNKTMNDVDFDFIIKKDNQVLFKGSDVYNNGKSLYTSNGNYEVVFTYLEDGIYNFEIPIFKAGNREFEQNGENNIYFEYEVKTEYDQVPIN